jgi:transposase
MTKYTIRHFREEFPDDDACLEWLKNHRFPGGIHCYRCDKITKHHRMHTRPSYSCQECGNHIHPTAGTIFHRSRTPLTIWFHAVYLMASTRCGISAKQVERETGVTYKTAWRMCNLIRSRLFSGGDPLSGEVEMDETYVGGKRRGGPSGRPSTMSHKKPVVGMVERGGRVHARVVPNVTGRTLVGLAEKHVTLGSAIYTDEYAAYNRLGKSGFKHDRVQHKARVYVTGDNVHTNTIEGFWSLVKRGINGVFHAVSPKYLQHYVDEYSFRYNHRDSTTPMFTLMLRRVGVRLIG